MKRRNLAVLVSGTGRNLEALIRAIGAGHVKARIVTVISNKADVRALDIAADAGIPSCVIDHREFADRADFDAQLAFAIDDAGADAVVLAGFMRILTAEFVQRYTGRMLNIHPSLLPLYRGLHTHRRALEDRQSHHGVSVHFVTPELDGGPVIKQGRISIHAEDDEISLATRIFNEIEQQLYPQVIGWLASGRLELHRGLPKLDDTILTEPLIEDFES